MPSVVSSSRRDLAPAAGSTNSFSLRVAGSTVPIRLVPNSSNQGLPFPFGQTLEEGPFLGVRAHAGSAFEQFVCLPLRGQ